MVRFDEWLPLDTGYIIQKGRLKAASACRLKLLQHHSPPPPHFFNPIIQIARILVSDILNIASRES